MATSPTPARWPALPAGRLLNRHPLTLHRWTQIVGKMRLALSPMANHWSPGPLYVTPRGLPTSALPYPAGAFDRLSAGPTYIR